MTDYSKGQIYKVVDNGLNMCYIGSTVQPLCKRMSGHRIGYERFLNGKGDRVAVYNIFDEYGTENCKITWIEDFSCNSKKELQAREGHHIRNNDCVNKRIEGRTNKEYRDEHREQIQDRKKHHYQNNRQVILEKTQVYRDNHKEESKEYFKQRYIEKKDEISENKKEHRQNNLEKVREQERQSYHRNKAVKNRPYTCECGVSLCHSGKARHKKTQKHQQYLQSINQNNPQE